MYYFHNKDLEFEDLYAKIDIMCAAPSVESYPLQIALLVLNALSVVRGWGLAQLFACIQRADKTAALTDVKCECDWRNSNAP